jgi:hypothetical protein
MYVDDNFGLECAEAHMFHAHSGHQLPAQQACLLDLWDDIGLLYDNGKQESRPSLHIIGFDVDPNAITISIPNDAHTKFFTHMADFIDISSTDCHHVGNFKLPL